MEALVNPGILRWARDRASLSSAALAKSLGTPEKNIEAWESGQKRPSFNQAINYANHTHIPFGFLFLSAPPEEPLPLPDLRTVNGNQNPEYSLNLRDTIRWALERQDWYREYLLLQGILKCEASARFSFKDNIETIVSDIRNALGIGLHPQRGNFGDYYSYLIQRIEAVGVLVMRNSIVNNNTSRPLSVDEFRGFAISDALAPLIFINTADCPEARLFTLAHELAHIWIGQSGVSDGGPGTHRNEEKVCNQVAAELLVPKDEFLKVWLDLEDWRDNLPVTTSHFHVSEWVIARRALTLGFIESAQYGAFITKKTQDYKNRAKDGKPTYNRLQTGRVSKVFAKAIASETLSGRMLFRDASRLIGIKPHNLPAFSKKELGF